MLAAILGVVALAGAPTQSDGAPPTAEPRPPAPAETADWVRRPTSAQVTQFWPVKALQSGAGGEATIKCEVNFDGALDNCKVIEETPLGFGFGDAALRLSSLFFMTKGVGKPDGPRPTVTIPIRWKGGHAMPALRDHYIAHLTGPRWLDAPNADEVASAYPARGGGVAGYVDLSCHVLRRDGAVGRCDTLEEEPAGRGFAKAALSLTSRFRARFDEKVRRDALDIWTDLRIRFPAPADGAPVDRLLADPDWLIAPTEDAAANAFPPRAAARRLKSGEGGAECQIASEGALQACVITPATPPDAGFSEAAAKVAAGLRLSAWTDAGGPIEGRRVRITLQFHAAGEEPKSSGRPP